MVQTIVKTKTLKKNKVNVITLGCSKNVYDSEVLMGQLKANNFTVEHEAEDSDASIVIINTCGFIENAKQESINTIIEYAEAKQRGLVDKVYVTGCLSERYKPELAKEIQKSGFRLDETQEYVAIRFRSAGNKSKSAGKGGAYGN